MIRRQAPLSLRARALAHLARRDHSRVELARKLAPHAADETEVANVLDALEQAGHLSTQRFVESLIRRRSAKYGLRRVEQELAEHKISTDLKKPLLDALKETEAERAWLAWERRFGSPPADLTERARQQRFLAARGFTGESVAAVFRRLRDRS
ncbi:MAG TPA: recombination regulator RecX [Burkholderiaceae bacterium]|nr:recombination regulator RecX [Burkholderiaceae bacterium]